jgi:hypothetical protein
MPDQEDTTTRIEKLEQELAALTTRVAALESRSTGSPSTGSASFTAVLVDFNDGPFREVKIDGSGFRGNEKVFFDITSVTRFPDRPQQRESGQADLTADEEGKLDSSFGIACPRGGTTTHTIRARGESSGRVEGESTVFC